MKVLVLGASGLIGHKLFQKLSERHDVYGTLRRAEDEYGLPQYFDRSRIFGGIDLLRPEVLDAVVAKIQPAVILNCVGITKRKISNHNRAEAIFINSYVPHYLARKYEFVRVIHFSTDCVFDGETGGYTESSDTNAKDIYGKSKALGELDSYANSLTIRSSFIGRELESRTELLEWALAQKSKKVKGYTNARYTGVTTNFLSSVVEEIIVSHSSLHGLIQLANPHVVSKYELLNVINDVYELGMDIVPDDAFHCYASLLGEKLSALLSIKVPSWREMLIELKTEDGIYGL